MRLCLIVVAVLVLSACEQRAASREEAALALFDQNCAKNAKTWREGGKVCHEFSPLDRTCIDADDFGVKRADLNGVKGATVVLFSDEYFMAFPVGSGVLCYVEIEDVDATSLKSRLSNYASATYGFDSLSPLEQDAVVYGEKWSKFGEMTLRIELRGGALPGAPKGVWCLYYSDHPRVWLPSKGRIVF